MGRVDDGSWDGRHANVPWNPACDGVNVMILPECAFFGAAHVAESHCSRRSCSTGAKPWRSPCLFIYFSFRPGNGPGAVVAAPATTPAAGPLRDAGNEGCGHWVAGTGSEKKNN